ncbi:DUF2927 domain-containing protein [Frigidibacter sp. MR17.14]|uniref:DUF2927 domain-containing protein n=1 Tax=Frigidibacter sp. MR17.14 TaxID=3126509 RepID=UPI003012D8AD
MTVATQPAPRTRRLGRLLAGVGLSILLANCAAGPEASRAGPAPVAIAHPPLPPMKRFTGRPDTPSRRANAELARDFLDLSFLMESGRALPTLSRFEGPIAVRLGGAVPPTAVAEAQALVGRLRSEARIPVRLADGANPPHPAEGLVSVEFLPRAEMHKLVPEAACFVVPRISSWAEYRNVRRTKAMDWGTLATRERAAVFIPADTSPQEVRDCLHEEVAQAMGPLNDLYSLHDTVFNDDNFVSALSGFDMVMLRTYNAPELHSGMTRAEVAALLPKVLERVNPAGGKVRQSAPADETPREWVRAVETALGPGVSATGRRSAARRAVEIAERQHWRDGRAGFSWFILGRLSLNGDLETAFTSFLRAALIFRSHPGMEIQAAHVDMQLAAFALSAGQAEDTLIFADRAIPAARKAQNAALLATLLFVRAEALELKGQKAAAAAVRLDGLGWARYGFGSDDEVWRRLAEIRALSPAAQLNRAAAAVAAQG